MQIFVFVNPRIKSEKSKVDADFEFLGKKRTKIKRFLVRKRKKKTKELENTHLMRWDNEKIDVKVAFR